MSDSDDSDFELLWRLHPRKKSKGDALKAWHQTSSVRPKFDELLWAHERARHDWGQRDVMFVPYLATWLRAQGWADEPDPEPTYDEIMARAMRKRWG